MDCIASVSLNKNLRISPSLKQQHLKDMEKKEKKEKMMKTMNRSHDFQRKKSLLRIVNCNMLVLSAIISYDKLSNFNELCLLIIKKKEFVKQVY